MYKNGFGINNLQLFMCHQTKPNKPNYEAAPLHGTIRGKLVLSDAFITVVD